jgi:hypothetical protein
MKYEAHKILSNFKDFNSHSLLNSVNFSRCPRHRIDAKVPVMNDKVKSAQTSSNGDACRDGMGVKLQEVTRRSFLQE